jgi:hypothetical protein
MNSEVGMRKAEQENKYMVLGGRHEMLAAGFREKRTAEYRITNVEGMNSVYFKKY